MSNVMWTNRQSSELSLTHEAGWRDVVLKAVCGPASAVHREDVDATAAIFYLLSSRPMGLEKTSKNQKRKNKQDDTLFPLTAQRTFPSSFLLLLLVLAADGRTLTLKNTVHFMQNYFLYSILKEVIQSIRYYFKRHCKLYSKMPLFKSKP